MSDGNDAAIRAKEEGNKAWSEGKFELSINCFTNAIKESSNKDILKILYSNRSAAYLKVNRITESLKDANKCLELDANWVKGYTRKGDALLASKQYTEAYNSYNSALRITPNDSLINEKCEQAMRAIRNTSSQRSYNNTRTNTNFNYITTSAALVIPSLYVNYIQMTVFYFSLFYCVPFIPISYKLISYRIACSLFVGLVIAGLYGKNGFPQINSSYYMKIVADPLMMELFLGLLLLLTRPYLFAIAPIILKIAISFSSKILEFLHKNLATAQQSLDSIIGKYIPSMRNINIAQVLNSVTSTQLESQLMKGCAFCEVYQGILLILELFTSSRNILQLYIWWQYIRMRCMTEATGDMKQTFAALDSRIQVLLNMNFCPSILRQGYSMLKTYLAKQIEIPVADTSSSSSEGQTGGISSGIASMASKCNIM